MDTNKMREQFEAVFVAKYGFGRLTASANADAHAMYQAAQWAWQASREAVVVEFPPVPEVPEDPEEAIDDSHMDAYHAAVRMRDGCVKAVEAQGLKVKP